MHTFFTGWALLHRLSARQPPALEQKPNTWVKRSPLQTRPLSPRHGLRGVARLRPASPSASSAGPGTTRAAAASRTPRPGRSTRVTAKWELKEPNTSPPGVCCAQQNVFDPTSGRFLRFPAFCGSHGWHWFREIYLNNSLRLDLRPRHEHLARHAARCRRRASRRCAARAGTATTRSPSSSAARAASEGTLVYDPYANTWTRMQPEARAARRSGGNMAYDAAASSTSSSARSSTTTRTPGRTTSRKNEWTRPEAGRAAADRPQRRRAGLRRRPASDRRRRSGAVDKTDGKEVRPGTSRPGPTTPARTPGRSMNPPREPDGWGNRRRIMVAMPDQNVILMESYVNPPSACPASTASSRSGLTGLPRRETFRPRCRLRSDCEDRGQESGHQPSGSAVAKEPVKECCEIQDSPWFGAHPWKVEMRRLADLPANQPEVIDTPFLDDTCEPGNVYHYQVRAVARDGTESLPTPMVRDSRGW